MRNFLAVVIILTLGACVTVRSNVQNFSNLPVDYQNKSVAVLGYPKKIEQSLEWRSYRPVFEKQFAEQGFVITDIENADFVAFVTYGIGEPQTTNQVGSVPVYGQTSGGTVYHSGNISSFNNGYNNYNYYGSSYTMPTYGIVGSSTYSYNLTSYTRTVAIDMIDKNSGMKVFESKATSTGSCGIIGEVIDEIAQAMFEKFPSGTGKVRVSAKNNDC